MYTLKVIEQTGGETTTTHNAWGFSQKQYIPNQEVGLFNHSSFDAAQNFAQGYIQDNPSPQGPVALELLDEEGMLVAWWRFNPNNIYFVKGWSFEDFRTYDWGNT